MDASSTGVPSVQASSTTTPASAVPPGSAGPLGSMFSLGSTTSLNSIDLTEKSFVPRQKLFFMILDSKKVYIFQFAVTFLFKPVFLQLMGKITGAKLSGMRHWLLELLHLFFQYSLIITGSLYELPRVYLHCFFDEMSKR
jgi:hypothetical protein